MILTITLNPSIDKRYDVEDFEKGGIFRTNRFQYTPGGKGINVSKVIKTLGGPVVATGFLGGSSGDYMKDKLEELEIDNDFVDVKGETRSCLNIVASDGSHTEILEAGPSISQGELENFYKNYEKLLDQAKLVVASGSLPLGLPKAIYGDLIKLAKKKGISFILDSSGEALEEGIEGIPYAIKPNKEELSKLLGRTIISQEDIIAGVRPYRERGIEIICISLGEKGALIFKDDYMYRVSIPQIEIQNTVGSGDAMVAGLALGLYKGYDFEHVLRLASACGTANAMELETGKVNLDNVKSLMEEINVEKIKLL